MRCILAGVLAAAASPARRRPSPATRSGRQAGKSAAELDQLAKQYGVSRRRTSSKGQGVPCGAKTRHRARLAVRPAWDAQAGLLAPRGRTPLRCLSGVPWLPTSATRPRSSPSRRRSSRSSRQLSSPSRASRSPTPSRKPLPPNRRTSHAAMADQSLRRPLLVDPDPDRDRLHLRRPERRSVRKSLVRADARLRRRRRGRDPGRYRGAQGGCRGGEAARRDPGPADPADCLIGRKPCGSARKAGRSSRRSRIATSRCRGGPASHHLSRRGGRADHRVRPHQSRQRRPAIRAGDVWTRAQCDAALDNDMRRFEADVAKAMAGVTLSQGELDALVSFDFNTGSLAKSSIPRKIRAGDKPAAMATLNAYNHAGGKVLAGLTRRRKAESSCSRARPRPR